MASAGRFMRQSQKFSKQFGQSLKSNSSKFSTTASGNLKKTVRCSVSVLGIQQSSLLHTVNKQMSKMDMRQLQNSVAVMSLSSKVSTCLTICAAGDSDVTEGSEDSDDVCSQPGHKSKNRRRKSRWLFT